MYLVVAEKQGARWDKISGTLQNDILKEYIAQKEWIYPIKPAMKLVIDTFGFCTEIGEARCSLGQDLRHTSKRHSQGVHRPEGMDLPDQAGNETRDRHVWLLHRTRTAL